MRMHLEGVKNALPVPAPVAIVLEIVVAITASAHDELVALAAITPGDEAPCSEAAIRAAPIPATVAGVVAVNKLFTLLTQAATTPLCHCV